MDRQAWADEHAQRIAALLDTSVHHDVSQRIWRLRYWTDDGYVVASLVHNLNVPGTPQQPIPKVQCDIIRPYRHVTSASLSSTVHLSLYGRYDPYQIVAFLALDTIDPDSVQWIDQTQYSDIVVVGDVLKRLRD